MTVRNYNIWMILQMFIVYTVYSATYLQENADVDNKMLYWNIVSSYCYFVLTYKSTYHNMRVSSIMHSTLSEQMVNLQLCMWNIFLQICLLWIFIGGLYWRQLFCYHTGYSKCDMEYYMLFMHSVIHNTDQLCTSKDRRLCNQIRWKN
jgi:hypothetical protein